MKLPASFRLITSCTFLLAPPRGSSSSQKNIFLFLLDKKVFLVILLFLRPLANGQVKSADISQGSRGGLKDSLSKGQMQQPTVGMRLVEEIKFVGP